MLFFTQLTELSGKELAGTATGIAFLILNTGGIFGSSLFGYLIDITENYKFSRGFVAFCMEMATVINNFQEKVT